MGARHAKRHSHSMPVLVEVFDCDDGVERAVMALPDYQVMMTPAPYKRHSDGSLTRDETWHRRGAIRGEAACGVTLDERTEAHVTRAYKLDDSLCEDCFTRHELAIGKTAAESHRMRTVNGLDPKKDPK